SEGTAQASPFGLAEQVCLLCPGAGRAGQIAVAPGQEGVAQPRVPRPIAAVLPAAVGEEGVVGARAVSVPGLEAQAGIAGVIVIAEIIMAARRPGEEGSQ